MSGIRVIKKGTDDCKKLELLAAILNYRSPNGYKYYVGQTYFDFGQNWMWTTVICLGNGEFGGYQALSPRDQEAALNANSVVEMDKVAADILGGKFCPDKEIA